MKNKWCDHAWSPWRGRQRVLAKNWSDPEKWNQTKVCTNCGTSNPLWASVCESQGCGRFKFRSRRVFLSLCDWLDDEVPIERLARFLNLIHDTPNLDWLLLTKRLELWYRRIRAAIQHNDKCRVGGGNYHHYYWLRRWLSGTPPNNVWIGVSVEDQQRADERIPELLKIPAKLRFLSIEPMLGPVDLENVPNHGFGEGQSRYNSIKRFAWECSGPEYVDVCRCDTGIEWVIVGGESGPRARPCNVEWIRDIVRQCRAVGVPVFVKQLGAKAYEEDFAHTKECWNEDCALSGGPEDCTGSVEREYFTLTHPKGGDPSEWPEDLRVRQMPEVKP